MHFCSSDLDSTTQLAVHRLFSSEHNDEQSDWAFAWEDNAISRQVTVMIATESVIDFILSGKDLLANVVITLFTVALYKFEY